MRIDEELLEGICRVARIRGRQRTVLELMSQDMSQGEIAARMGITEGTVRSHQSQLRQKIQRAQLRQERREELRFLLREVIPGPLPSNPAAGLYRVVAPGEGERVRLHAGPIVIVDDLLPAQDDSL